MPDLIDPNFAWLGVQHPSFKFYEDTVTLYFDEEPHVYYRHDAEGRRVDVSGVTTVVHILDKSGPLTQWAANMACGSVRNSFAEHQLFNFETPVSQTHVDSWLETAKYAHKAYKDAAGETGHIAHAWIDDFIKRAIQKNYLGMMHMLDNLPEDERARNGCYAALDWMARHRVIWIFTERKIYSKKHDFAGTMDGLALVSACGDVNCCGEWQDHVKVAATFVDVLSVIDWKTSNALYNEYHYQTAAYLLALTEELGFRINHRFIARLGKEDGQFESCYIEADRTEGDIEIFLSCLDLYRKIETRKRSDKAHKDAVKARKAAEKAAAEAAEKERKAARKLEIKEARQYAKDYYKILRQNKENTVAIAEAEVERWLTRELLEIDFKFGVETDEEFQEAA